MRFHVLPIFPRMFDSPFAEGVVRRGKDHRSLSFPRRGKD